MCVCMCLRATTGFIQWDVYVCMGLDTCTGYEGKLDDGEGLVTEVSSEGHV